MKTEKDLIPYSTAELPKGPFLVFAPHPDDEAMGLGGTLILASKKGIHTTVIFLTDGELGGDPTQRRMEANEAAKLLGIKHLEFWNLGDRKLISKFWISSLVKKALNKYRPQTIFLPSPLEYHPDHRAGLIHLYSGLNAANFTGKIWLYEISRQAEANRLIDITSVVEEKLKAISCYKSQMAQRPYGEIAISINRARSYTLPEYCKYAEAFFCLAPQDSVFSAISRDKYLQDISILNELPLVSVIIRTKDRPIFLKKALESLSAQYYPNIEAVVINDGGCDVSQITKEFESRLEKLNYIALDQSCGRTHAANIGLKNSSGEFCSFLDDDDIFYPDHIEKLIRAHNDTQKKIIYSDCIIACCKISEAGEIITTAKYPFYSDDFSFDHLVLENYIPIICLLFKRELLIEIGGFDESFNLFEDWDLLIRLGQNHQFHHLKKITCEYRQWENGQITKTTQGTENRKDAYIQLLKKHQKLVTPLVIYKYFCLAGLRKEEIVWLKRRLDDSEKHIQQLKQKIKKDLRKKESELKELSKNFESLAQIVIEKDSELKRLHKHLNEIQLNMEKINEQRLFYQKKYLEVINSKGWRLLEFLRRIKKGPF